MRAPATAAGAKCTLCWPDPLFLRGEREKFRITFFADYSASSLTAKEMSLGELRDLILATSAPTKDELPWLKLASSATRELRTAACGITLTSRPSPA
jgi:hypothetical protein